MRSLLAAALLCLSVSVADAGLRCPPGTYVTRYSFGIWVCKRQDVRARLACPPGENLSEDHVGTPACVRNGSRRWDFGR
jgi:hypothetical protein